MLSLGSLTFAEPAILAALMLLPALYPLLRLTPPAPLSACFPPVRLLSKLNRQDAAPAAAPPWLLILRLLLAALIIIGFAHPLLNASTVLRGQGPLVLVIDDGWASGVNWPARQAAAKVLIDQAARENRQVMVITTAPSREGGIFPDPASMRAAEAAKLLSSLQPKPWPTNRQAALASLLARGLTKPGHVAWLSDGLAEGSENELVERLGPLGEVTLLADPPDKMAIVLLEPSFEGASMVLHALRALPGPAALRRVGAFGADGTALGFADLAFASGETMATARLELPAAAQSRLTRLAIKGETTAAATILIDDRWRRRSVGLIAAEGTGSGAPLLSGQYYIERALGPFAEIYQGNIEQLLERKLSLLILDDPDRMEDALLDKLEKWISNGGVLIRFAGPKLAQAQGKLLENLLPVPLRLGERSLGGAMSWAKPAALASFDEDSLFFGLTIPGDITISRQVLARPSPDLAAKTWARLSDGTPLVTAEKRGQGRLILVHATASPAWSNLPLSLLFVNMLRRMAELGQGVEDDLGNVLLWPLGALDGFGRLSPPPASALSIAARDFDKATPGPGRPPGFYGIEKPGIENPETKTARRALNLAERLPALGPFQAAGGVPRDYAFAAEIDLRPWLLALALFLLMADLAISLMLRGLLGPWLAASLGALLILFGGAANGLASNGLAPAGALETRLAYLITDDARIDEISRAGLRGLGVVVNRRTTAELGDPVGVNPETDELSFYPLIYWPAAPNSKPLSKAAAAKITAFLQNGGIIVFDSRGFDDAFDKEGNWQELAAKLNITGLEPISMDHVLARSFYLLRAFSGRFGDSGIWIERAGERINDGVATIIASDHDWAGAWAMDDAERPLFAVSPGGEQQREAAYRFGVNLTMYALTGNYKADQIHLKSILERLGD